MGKHILDRPVEPDAPAGDAPLDRYARVARSRMSQHPSDRKLMMLQRRRRGPWNPGARVQAFARIERGYRV